MPSTYVPPVRHQWIDPWRSATGPAMVRMVEEARAAIEEHERHHEPRTRKRKTADETRHRAAVDVLVSNLAHAVLIPPETGRLAFSTRNGEAGRTRYDNPALGQPVRKLLWRMWEIGMIDFHLSTTRGEASSFAPTDTFARTVRVAGITLSDFGKMPGEEAVILSRNSGKGEPGQFGGYSELVAYADDHGTMRMREEVQTISAFTAAADITFHDDGLGLVDQHQRAMRRHFVLTPKDLEPRFDQCGRLFGGFWQNLKKSRRAGIRIENEGVAVVDFASMFPRLAFAHVGEMPPPEDLYAIPGLEQHRPVVKKAFSTLLFDTGPRKTWPSEFLIAEDEGDPASFLPLGWTVGRLKEAILSRHPALKPCFGHGLGHGLMFTESRILILALLEMRARGIIGLGLHDGILVPTSQADLARQIMMQAGQDVTGAILPVDVQAVSGEAS